MSYLWTKTQPLTSSIAYAPADYLTTYTGVSHDNTYKFVMGSLSDVNIRDNNYLNDPTTGLHQLYTLQVQGSYASYTASNNNGLITLTDTQNGQNIQFQLTKPQAGISNVSGVDVQFQDGGLAFASYVDANSGAWTTYATKGGGTQNWVNPNVAAIPATGQSTLNLSALGVTQLNAADALSPVSSDKYALVASTWSSAAGYGAINLDSALTLATANPIPHINPPQASLSTLNWGISVSNFMDAWNAGYTGKGITIAEIDSGLDLNNPALTGNLLQSLSAAFASIQDFNGHGTFVASQMIANSLKPAPVMGGAYDASLLALNSDAYVAGSYKGIQNDIAAGITYAVDNGANVINISQANAPGNELLTALQYATQKGVIVAISAGNSGVSTPEYISAYAQTLGDVIAVGATQYNTQGTVTVAGGGISQDAAGFSNQAGSVAAYNYVNAPGAYVLGYGLTPAGGTAPVKPGSGTSYSSPIVAAEAAVVMQAVKQANPNFSPQEVAAAVVHDITVGLIGVAPNVDANMPINPYST